MGWSKLPSSPWDPWVHECTCPNPWAHGPHGKTIARDIPLSHSDHPISVWLSHFPSSHVRMGYPINDNMSQSVRGPVSKKKSLPYCPTTLLPYGSTIILPYHHSYTAIPHLLPHHPIVPLPQDGDNECVHLEYLWCGMLHSRIVLHSMEHPVLH